MAVSLSEPADVLVLGVVERVAGLAGGDEAGGRVRRAGLVGGVGARDGRGARAGLGGLLLLLALLALVVLVPGIVL